MQIIEINHDNIKKLYDYWNKVGKGIPYFYEATYESFKNSILNDSFEGTHIFKKHKVYYCSEDNKIIGFIQFGIPMFHYTKIKMVPKDINIGVIRNLYYDETRPNIGKLLLDLAINFFKRCDIKDIYAFYHAMGMSCNGNHGKLHEKFKHINNFLLEMDFEIEHENIYYVCDMKQRKLKDDNNTHIEITKLDENRQKIVLYDDRKNIIGNAIIKLIDKLTKYGEVDIVYLVWIAIKDNIKGKGLGTEFLNHIIRYYLAKGYIYMHTDTAINNKIAQKFYIKNDFVESGITRSYKKIIN